MISVNNINLIYRKVRAEDFELLLQYLLGLSPDSQKRFGPHRFDLDTIIGLYTNGSDHFGYLAFDEGNGKIIAYAIIQKGYLDHDSQRLQSYGINPNQSTDCTYAPSVADDYQGLGIGTGLFKYILSDLQNTTFSRIILWGGVQADNERAVRYYLHNGFIILGEFHYNGKNYDMIYNMPQ